MATWASLSQEQQAVVQAWQRSQAAWASAQAKANDLGALVDTAYLAQVAGLSLGSTEVVPLSLALDGAQSMTYSDLVSIESHIEGVAATYNESSHRQLWAKACGSINL